MFPVAEFYYRVWRLTPETHRFYIPLPKVNSFYNQVALTYTQQQYEKLRHTHTHTHTSTTQTEEESIIPAAALYDAQIIIRLITHAAHSPFHPIHSNFLPVDISISSVSLSFSLSRGIFLPVMNACTVYFIPIVDSVFHTHTHTQTPNVDNGTRSLNHVCKRREGRREQDQREQDEKISNERRVLCPFSASCIS